MWRQFSRETPIPCGENGIDKAYDKVFDKEKSHANPGSTFMVLGGDLMKVSNVIGQSMDWTSVAPQFAALVVEKRARPKLKRWPFGGFHKAPDVFSRLMPIQ